jgi:hypothetical protein
MRKIRKFHEKCVCGKPQELSESEDESDSELQLNIRPVDFAPRLSNADEVIAEMEMMD